MLTGDWKELNGVTTRYWMGRNTLLVTAFCAIMSSIAAKAEPISATHIQGPMHRFMVARSEAGKVIANGEFSQVVQGD